MGAKDFINHRVDKGSKYKGKSGFDEIRHTEKER